MRAASINHRFTRQRRLRRMLRMQPPTVSQWSPRSTSSYGFTSDQQGMGHQRLLTLGRSFYSVNRSCSRTYYTCSHEPVQTGPGKRGGLYRLCLPGCYRTRASCQQVCALDRCW